MTSRFDPVCGMAVRHDEAAAITRQYAGTTYYFCSADCSQRFEGHPEQFASGRSFDAEQQTLAGRATSDGREHPDVTARTAPATMESGAGPRANWPGRLAGFASASIGTVAGITPHVLHHIGPIAGAALVTGTEGSVLFGVLGFVLTIPLLLRLKKRFRSWLPPAIALTLFAIMFTTSTVWIGPAIRGDEGNGAEERADPHHAVRVLPAGDEQANRLSRP